MKLIVLITTVENQPVASFFIYQLTPEGGNVAVPLCQLSDISSKFQDNLTELVCLSQSHDVCASLRCQRISI